MRRPWRIGFLVVVGAATLALGAGTPPAHAVGAPRGRTTGGDLRVVDINLLHGTFCDDGHDCQATDRVALFTRQIEDARCPEVVGLQEISDHLRPLVRARLRTLCRGKYHPAFAKVTGNDKELVLTTLPASHEKVLPLPGGLRSASRVRLASALGPVVLVVTHQDGDSQFPACRDDIARYHCPPPCPVGATFSACQTILGERLATAGGPKPAIHIYMGDFNLPAGTPRYAALIASGWVDAHLAAGNPECDPATGVQCTSGRDDVTLAALKDPAARESERIDFIFVKPPASCAPRFDPATDNDHDGVGTGLFSAQPAVGGPGGLVWPSDHTAVSMDLSCA